MPMNELQYLLNTILTSIFQVLNAHIHRLSNMNILLNCEIPTANVREYKFKKIISIHNFSIIFSQIIRDLTNPLCDLSAISLLASALNAITKHTVAR